MPDPALQAVWKRVKWALGGITFVIALVKGMGETHSITPSVTMIGIPTAVLLSFAAEFLIRRHRPEWRLTGSGRLIRITSLSIQPRWFLFGVLAVLLIPRFIDVANAYLSRSQPENIAIEEKRYPQ